MIELAIATALLAAAAIAAAWPLVARHAKPAGVEQLGEPADLAATLIGRRRRTPPTVAAAFDALQIVRRRLVAAGATPEQLGACDQLAPLLLREPLAPPPLPADWQRIFEDSQ